ncbi:hypothetical protein GCM10010193_34070 [Kitasatospora atroaurantiaca]|uniref:Uncharacterized protein n=1 Tax=Kitasatospora atroaurantiaca TaxID=285545 RepID=A0A561ENR0_9ACTN|nr:hypothetical protein [Kitasatospora atroaurantiaca]TWE17261.1 hypothetical protein FB465_2269 [Kitasatospora atroaurantiaca]
MGALGFFAALLLSVMGMGRWKETGSPYWLIGSIALFVLTLVGALTSRGGRKKAG